MAKGLKSFLAERPDDAEIYAVFEKMTRDSDRGSAVAAVAMIDDVMQGVVKSHLPELDEEDDRFLFSPSGPLGAASVQTRLAFALGIIGPKTRSDLERTREIRNAFAHTIRDLAFDNASLKNMVESLNALKDVTQTGFPTKIKFVQSCRKLMLHLVGKMHKPHLHVAGIEHLD